MTFPAVSLDVSPDGQWLFALSEDNATIQEYQINTSTGALTIQQPATYSITTGAAITPKMVRIAPNGAYVIAALGTAGDVVFPFTTSTGVFGTTYQTLPTGNAASSDNALTIDSATTYLYIARSGASSGLAVYAIGTNGALSGVTGSPFAAGQGPHSVLLDSTGKYAYVGNLTDSTISGYAIGTGSVLTPLSGSPYASGSSVDSLARDNSGKYMLAAAGGGSPDLTMYSFDTTTAGALDSAASAATGTDPTQPLLVVATH
jgi:6-phosphogluconolactonase